MQRLVISNPMHSATMKMKLLLASNINMFHTAKSSYSMMYNLYTAWVSPYMVIELALTEGDGIDVSSTHLKGRLGRLFQI